MIQVVLLVGAGKQTNSRPISFIIEEAKKLWGEQTRLYYVGVGTAFDRALVERFVPPTDIIKFTTLQQTSTPVLTTIRKLTTGEYVPKPFAPVIFRIKIQTP